MIVTGVLIERDTPWPPPGDAKLRNRWQSWAAWWSGDLDDLAAHTPATAPHGYWAHRAQAGDTQRRIHLPLASDMARTSSELVFGDSPTLEFGGAQDDWDELAAQLGWANTLLESGEISAATGGVYLRPQWDRELAERPLSTVVRPDEAIPQFRFGILVSVTFVTTLDGSDNKDVLRWLEHHEPGQIRHELWRGTATTIGRQAPLTDHPTTATLPGEPIDTREIRPLGGLLVEYVPNVLPQPLSRKPHGRSDFQAKETLLDSLDGAWASWMRDLDLGKARIVVPQEYLDHVQPNPGKATGFFGKFRNPSNATKAFDTDAEVFTGLPGMSADDNGKPAQPEQVQFDLRVQEHMDTCGQLVDEIVSRAGYAPQTFGRHVEGQLSGTAMTRREHRSDQTRDRKRQYAESAVERYAETLMLINASLFSGPAVTERPKLTWPTDGADPKETAETIELLRRAEAVSTEVSVRMAHPEWDDDEVSQEVARIQSERPAAPELDGLETPDQLEGGDGAVGA